MNKYVVVSTAGKGTHIKPQLYKVLHKVCGKTMVGYVVNAVKGTNPDKIITVVGSGADSVKDVLTGQSDSTFQEQQLDTGGVVLAASDLLENLDGSTLVAIEDTPLFTVETFNNLFKKHEESGNSATVSTAKTPNPFDYGRIIRDEGGNVLRVVGQKDGTPEELAVDEINIGVFCFDNKELFKALKQVGNDNAQGEYYLADILEIMCKAGHKVGTCEMPDFSGSLGINDRIALTQATKIMQRRINEEHMKNGISFIDPDTVHIDNDVKIGNDAVIKGNVVIKGNTEIGSDCYITNSSRVVDSKIGNHVTITSSALREARTDDNTDVGLNSHLRPKAIIKRGAHIGSFVEIKKAETDENSRVGHLTYVRSATLDRDTNTGCGTIFSNYDSVKKLHTNVGDHSFIGAGATIIAPVNIADHSFVAADPTITKDAARYDMAIARRRQTNKLDYQYKLPLSKDKEWEQAKRGC